MSANTPENVERAVLNRDAIVYPSVRDLVDSGYMDCSIKVVEGQSQESCRLTEKGRVAYVAGARAWKEVREVQA